MRCSLNIVFPSVLSRSNLKRHQTLEVRNIFEQENLMLQLMFKPGLMLTGFQTTWQQQQQHFIHSCTA